MRLLLGALVFSLIALAGPAKGATRNCSARAFINAEFEGPTTIGPFRLSTLTEVTRSGSAVRPKRARMRACSRAARDVVAEYETTLSEGDLHSKACSALSDSLRGSGRKPEEYAVSRLSVEGFAPQENKRHDGSHRAWGLKCGPAEVNAHRPSWLHVFSPGGTPGTFQRIDRVGNTIVFAGDVFGRRRGFFAGLEDRDEIWSGGIDADLNTSPGDYWDVALAESQSGRRQTAIAVGNGSIATTGRRFLGALHRVRRRPSHVSIRTRSRPSTSIPWGTWSEPMHREAEFFQLISIAAAHDAPRFFVGATWPLSSQGPLDDLASGYVLELDVEGQELARHEIAGRSVVITDLVVAGDILYAVGNSGGLYDVVTGTQMAPGVFVRAYRLAGVNEARAIRSVLWTEILPAPVDADAEAPPFPVAASGRPGVLYVARAANADIPGAEPVETEHFRPSGYTNGYIMKLRGGANGAEVEWIRKFGSAQVDVPLAIAASTSCGNLYVGGATGHLDSYSSRRVFRSAHAFRSSLDQPGSPRGDGAFLVALDPDGSTRWSTSNLLGTRLTDEPGRGAAITDLEYEPRGNYLFFAGDTHDSWVQNTSNQTAHRVFIGRIRDSQIHNNIRCERAPQVPEQSTSCLNTPDMRSYTLPCMNRIVPHEGFRGSPTCANGFDDDWDGLCDAVDPDCQATQSDFDNTIGCCPRGPDDFETRENWTGDQRFCTDGIDNDMDGTCDALEPECRPPWPVPREPTLPNNPRHPNIPDFSLTSPNDEDE